MWRIELSISGSYTGRIAPPGRPNMTSTPSISRLLMRACAPVSCIAWSLPSSGYETPLALARGGSGARARGGGRALRNYEDLVAAHDLTIVPDRMPGQQPTSSTGVVTADGS